MDTTLKTPHPTCKQATFSPGEKENESHHIGNSARFWLNLQTAYELAVAERQIGERIMEEVRPQVA